MAYQTPSSYSGVDAPPEYMKSPIPPSAPSAPETTSWYPLQPMPAQPPPPEITYPPQGYFLQERPGYLAQQVGYPPQRQGLAIQQQGYPLHQGVYPHQHAGTSPPGYQQPEEYPAVATGYPPHGQVYVQQPGGYRASNTTGTAGVAVNDYMVLSIVSCLFCWCLGLLAINKSSESRSNRNAGNYELAAALAKSARNLGVVSIVCGIALYFITVMIVITQVY